MAGGDAVAHLLEHIRRAIRAHACRYAMLDEVTIPAVADDDQVQFWGDIRYLGELVDEIEHVCKSTRGTIADHGLAEFDVDIYLEPFPPDKAAELLAEWRAA